VLPHDFRRLGLQYRIGVIADQLAVVALAVPERPVRHGVVCQWRLDVGPGKVRPHAGEIRGGCTVLRACPQAGIAAAAANVTYKRKSRRFTFMISSVDVCPRVMLCRESPASCFAGNRPRHALPGIARVMLCGGVALWLLHRPRRESRHLSAALRERYTIILRRRSAVQFSYSAHQVICCDAALRQPCEGECRGTAALACREFPPLHVLADSRHRDSNQLGLGMAANRTKIRGRSRRRWESRLGRRTWILSSGLRRFC
jgi:hypothetical protein